MEDTIRLGDDIVVKLDPRFSQKVGEYPFPPFGYLELYVNMSEGLIIFYMKPRFKDVHHPGFSSDILGPSDIIRFYETQLNNLKKHVEEYTGISLAKNLKPVEPPNKQ